MKSKILSRSKSYLGSGEDKGPCIDNMCKIFAFWPPPLVGNVDLSILLKSPNLPDCVRIWLTPTPSQSRCHLYMPSKANRLRHGQTDCAEAWWDCLRPRRRFSFQRNFLDSSMLTNVKLLGHRYLFQAMGGLHIDNKWGRQRVKTRNGQ